MGFPAFAAQFIFQAVHIRLEALGAQPRLVALALDLVVKRFHVWGLSQFFALLSQLSLLGMERTILGALQLSQLVVLSKEARREVTELNEDPLLGGFPAYALDFPRCLEGMKVGAVARLEARPVKARRPAVAAVAGQVSTPCLDGGFVLEQHDVGDAPRRGQKRGAGAKHVPGRPIAGGESRSRGRRRVGAARNSASAGTRSALTV